MAKYNIPKLLVAFLEDKVKGVVGEGVIAELRTPVAEAELQAQLNAAAERAEERWRATYADRDAREAVQGMPLADLPAVQSAIRRMYDDPNTPVTAETLRAQLSAIVPARFDSERIENAIAAYLESLRLELMTIDGLREKLIGLTQLRIEQNTETSAEELKRIRQLLEGLVVTTSSGQAGKAHAANAEELARLEADYRRLLIDSFKNLDFKGLTTSVRPMLLPLEKVYVQLRAVAEVPEAADEFTPEERRVLRHLEEREREGRGRDDKQLDAEARELYLRLDAARRERWSRERLERFSIAESLKNPDRRGLAILGDPGSGKTTLLHFAALVFARGPETVTGHLGIDGQEADRLPIFAPLAFYDDMRIRLNPDLTIGEFLGLYYEKRWEMPGLAPLFQRALETGRALVLLDGLDEVIREDDRKFVAGQASAFIRRAIARGNRVFLTSRIYGYRAAPLSVDLPHVTVLDFRREEIELFAHQWNEAMAEWEFGDRPPEQRQRLAQENERNLLEEIRSNPGVERLAANPLLLSMLALLRRQVGRLPQQRIRLYAQYMGALIDVWETNRTPGGRAAAPSRPDSTKAELVLIPLALWLQQHRGSGTATRADLVSQIAKEYLREEGFEIEKRKPAIPLDKRREAEARADKFLEDMRQFSGLLVDRGQNAFGFRHLTFQEYFAGRGLARMNANQRWKLIQPNLHANRWREPILLAAAQLGTMQADGKAATVLVRKILGARSAHETALQRDLFLAADCAADDINLDLPFLRQLVKELSALAPSPVPKLAAETIRRLVNLARLSSGEKPRLPEASEALRLAVPVLRPDPLFFSVREAGGINLQTFVTLTATLYADYPTVRAAVAAKLGDENDPQGYVRAAAIRALAGLVGSDETVRAAVAAKLGDENDPLGQVRAAAIRALAPLIPHNATVRRQLAPTLQLDDREEQSASRVYRDPETLGPRAMVVRGFSQWLGRDPAAWAEVVGMLSSEDWRLRLSGVEVVSAAGKETVRQATPRLLAAMDDHRGYDSWPARIAAAELLLNDLHHSQQAIDTIVPALEYGAHPLVVVPNAAEIRTQAALALGKLKADFRQPEVAGKLEELLAKEKNPKVLDSLFNALSSLAAAPEET